MSGKIRNPARRCKICGGKCKRRMRYCKLCAKKRGANGEMVKVENKGEGEADGN